MTEISFITIVIFAFTLLAVLGYLVYYLAANVFNPTGKGAEKKTARILRKFGWSRGFKTLSGVTLSVDGKSADIENMLIGHFGILLVRTCGARGAYYGALDSKTWTVTSEEDSGKKYTVDNPLTELHQTEALLRSLFSRNKVYSVPIESVVYMTSRSKQWALFISNNGEIQKPGKLSGYLHKEKFEKDAGLDVEKIAALVAEHSSASRQSQ